MMGALTLVPTDTTPRAPALTPAPHSSVTASVTFPTEPSAPLALSLAVQLHARADDAVGVGARPAVLETANQFHAWLEAHK